MVFLFLTEFTYPLLTVSTIISGSWGEMFSVFSGFFSSVFTSLLSLADTLTCPFNFSVLGFGFRGLPVEPPNKK